MKLPKTLIKIGLVLLIIATVVLVVRAVFNYVEGRKLTRTLAELKDGGLPLTARDLAVPCPDEDNAARLWKAAESLLTTEEGKGRQTISGAFGRYAGGTPIEASSRASLQDLAVQNSRALELMAEAGAKPCFLLRGPSTPLIESIIPSAIKMIHATQLLGFSSLFMAEDGNVPGAIDRIRPGLRFAPLLAGEGTLMTYLIAVADTRMLTLFLGDICRGRDIGDDTLVRLIGELDPAPWRERLARSISGERILALERGSAIIKGGSRVMAGERLSNRLLYWLLRPILKDEVRYRQKKLVAWERIAREPYFQQRELLKTDPAFSESVPWYFKLTGFWEGDAYGTVFLKSAQLEASLLAARTGIACKVFKSRTGAYPESLEALVPGILKVVPVDPFTGKPFVYRREGKGFIVYSLGSNEKDDGGRSTYMITQMVMEKDDDWAWKEDR
ncbi:MAG: hypothetical protein IMZ57_01550 [Acidobacteria bacterium]|nr:hypothetical protein [Acidobacteriota bacterium]